MRKNHASSNDDVVRISMSLPSDLLDGFERTMKRAGFTDRSKAIQAAMRVFISENEWVSEESSKGAGLIELLYDPQTRNIDKALTLIQHEYNHIVTSSTHIHLDDNNCMEVIIVRGDAKSIKKLARELAGKKGVKSIRINFVKVI